MASFDLIYFAAAALMVGGLVSVLAETLLKDPRSLLEMMEDSRRFAEVPVRVEETRRPATPAAKAAANQDHPRLAA